LAGIEKRYDELSQLMADPAVIADYNRLRETGQERTSLEPIVHAYHNTAKPCAIWTKPNRWRLMKPTPI
jgi:protein subunit release factor A